MKNDTIFAVASGAVPSGVAVIRISGPECRRIVRTMTGREVPAPRRAVLADLRAPDGGEYLDQCLALWFPGPGSFTGEDVVEFQVHGGRAVVQGVLDALAGLSGVRPAEAGEFSRRAFENGKLDLTAVEGIADLVAAETAAQRRQALRQMDGELGRLYDDWRERLVRALAHFEAVIDFSDEDLPGNVEQEVRAEVEAVRGAIRVHLADDHRGERLRSGFRIAIIGPPNVGKSSLLNRLARRDVAIVSETAGTTRDVIEVHLDLGGYPVVVADTAGLRQGEGEVEEEGIRRAEARAEEADLRIVVLDAGEPEAGGRESARWLEGGAIVVVNKIDLHPGGGKMAGEKGWYAISAKTGEGIDRLLAEIETSVGARFGAQGALSLTRNRHRLALEGCLVGLGEFIREWETELAAEELRGAVRALGAITGRVNVEDLLDRIFADFCIGK